MDFTLKTKKIELTIDEFKKIRDFIYEKSGLFFADSKKYLVDDRINRRMKELELDKVEAYFHFIKHDVNKDTELTKLFDEVTTNETYFFRNVPQIDSYKLIVLPELIKSKKAEGKKEIKIWSAACSSGEEPYTLAVVLTELLGADIINWKIQIIATDISNLIIEKAKLGRYTKNTLRNFPPNLVKKYFIEKDNFFEISEKIKKNITFQYLNLVDRMKMRLIRNIDVIFCRNVLIYFDTDSKKQVISSLYSSLNDNGYLFIGHSESLHGCSSNFKLVHLKNTMVYKKGR